MTHVLDPQIRAFVSSLTEDMACELADQMGDLGDSFMLTYARNSVPRLADLSYLHGAQIGIWPGAGMSARRTCASFNYDQLIETVWACRIARRAS